MTAAPRITTPLLAAALAALLAGCGGGGTKTVTVASTPSTVATTTTATTPRTDTTTTSTSTTAPSSEHGGTAATTTRTAPAPAFTHEGTPASTGATAEGLSGAEAVLRGKGYTASATSEYHPDQTLRVLVGRREGSGQQAFFFIGGHYLGTDSKQPSAQIHVVNQSDTEVTLAYSLSGSSAKEATVRFQLNNGKLVPLDPIPSASSRQ